jgi:hypothetical protein
VALLLFFFTKICLFHFFGWTKNRANCSKQLTAPSIKLFRTRFKKINVFHRIINQRSNQKLLSRSDHRTPNFTNPKYFFVYFLSFFPDKSLR